MSDIGPADTNMAGGAGFRYMLTEEQKLSIGVDADGTEVSIYFKVGDWLAN